MKTRAYLKRASPKKLMYTVWRKVAYEFTRIIAYVQYVYKQMKAIIWQAKHRRSEGL